ncbi:MAG: iron chelate uptake ABC transporter family permease subunit, partial [Limnochordia bacterium]
MGRIALILVILGAVVIFAASVGTVSIPCRKVLAMIGSTLPGLGQRIPVEWTAAQETIVLRVRLPRVLLAMVVGGGLSV